MDNHAIHKDAIDLLKALIATPSFSREENKTADLIEGFLEERGVKVQRLNNNVWAASKNYDASKPTVLLNSHHDTVKPNKGYTKDPFVPEEQEGKLYGLGSNDAGGCLVSLIAAFVHFYNAGDLKYNLLLAATAEEEISGHGGVEALIPLLPPVHTAIVGEPTLLQMAVAERGLMVLDAVARGKAGHAARNEGDNALYKAVRDINWIMEHQFPKVSPLLGPVKLNATVMETENKAHNVVPAECHYVIDVRVNELYTFEEVLQVLNDNLESELKPRSTRLRSTMIPDDHPLVKAGTTLGLTSYGSPTTSDKALMPFPALKLGPGDSARSHTADEFIFIDEIKKGIDLYIQLLNRVVT
jgi:acetylornithine deacetylase